MNDEGIEKTDLHRVTPLKGAEKLAEIPAHYFSRSIRYQWDCSRIGMDRAPVLDMEFCSVLAMAQAVVIAPRAEALVRRALAPRRAKRSNLQ